MNRKSTRGSAAVLMLLAMGLLDLAAPRVVSTWLDARSTARQQWETTIAEAGTAMHQPAATSSNAWEVAGVGSLSFDPRLQESAAELIAPAARP